MKKLSATLAAVCSGCLFTTSALAIGKYKYHCPKPSEVKSFFKTCSTSKGKTVKYKRSNWKIFCEHSAKKPIHRLELVVWEGRDRTDGDMKLPANKVRCYYLSKGNKKGNGTIVLVQQKAFPLFKDGAVKSRHWKLGGEPFSWCGGAKNHSVNVSKCQWGK